jgi:hypothetical protein
LSTRPRPRGGIAEDHQSKNSVAEEARYKPLDEIRQGTSVS